MNTKSFTKKDLHILFPVVISGFLCIGLVVLMTKKYNVVNSFGDKLGDLAPVFMTLSGFLALTIIGYLAFSVLNLKNSRKSSISTLNLVTDKMHNFRSIVQLLLNSKMWMDGLKTTINDEFEGLNFFDLKEFYKGKSKLAIEFLQENHKYGETENLYLEMKSLLMTNPKQKRIPSNLDFPELYNTDIIKKWIHHKCGSGLWYFFGYKYTVFKEFLKLELVYDRHQDKIMKLANAIDSDYFEDSSFNEVFLSRLGEYMNKQVLPKLHQNNNNMNTSLSGSMDLMFVIFILLVVFGILLPIFHLIFTMPVILLIISYSIIISLIFLILSCFYQLLIKAMEN